MVPTWKGLLSPVGQRDVGFLGFCPGVFLSMGVRRGEGIFPAMFFILFLVVRFVFVLFSVFPPPCFPGSPGGAADPGGDGLPTTHTLGEHRQPWATWTMTGSQVSELASVLLPGPGVGAPGSTRPEGRSMHSRQKIPVRPCFPCRHRAEP